jgi:alkylhydroperoxidase family enzyme
MNLLIPAVIAAFSALGLGARFPMAKPDDAWALLPRDNPPLPSWARVMVKSLPRTTGALLELDRLHRADNPLGPVIAAKLRWVAADEIGCEYARASALADLNRAGAANDEVRRLTEDRPSPDDKGLFSFARQITKAAYLVTDAEFDALLQKLGPEKMTTVVHTLAFANFHNRIILALGVKVEPGGPCPPLAIKLDARRRSGVATPARPPWERVTEARPMKNYDAPTDWKDVSFAELEKGLAAQKARKPRVSLPDPGRFNNLSPDLKQQANAIVWTAVSGGYQPVMTQAWFAGLREFQQEAKLNRVFASSLFWVVTRANDCFY